MQPDDSRPTTPSIPQRDSPSTPSAPNAPEHQAAAANIIRGQINSILDDHEPVANSQEALALPERPLLADQPVARQTPQATNPVLEHERPGGPYQHTHDTTEHASAQSANPWHKYHSAWQRYYQEYYSRYYVGELYKTQTELMKRAQETAEVRQDTEGMTKGEAINDLRSQLRQRIEGGAKKVRGSRHFIPITSALVVMAIFAFLQYNSLIFAAVAAYSSPGSLSPANIIVNPDESITVPESENNHLIVPKLNIDVPIDFNSGPDYNSQMDAMTRGVSYFGISGADAKPGQVGNFGIAGHSSNQWYDNGSYKFIFVNLTELQKGDTFYITYNDTRYTYSIDNVQIVDPNSVSALQDNATKPEATLITCTPSGTALHRLLVTGEQVSPSPTGAQAAAPTTSSQSTTNIPGNSPTIFEKLFGG